MKEFLYMLYLTIWQSNKCHIWQSDNQLYAISDSISDLGRQAGQIKRSLQTSLPELLTWCINKWSWCNHHLIEVLSVLPSILQLADLMKPSFGRNLTFNIAMSFSTAVRLNGIKNRCWRFLFFLISKSSKKFTKRKTD